MNEYPQISRLQFFFIFAIANICLTPFGFPTLLIKQLDHQSWIAPLVALLLTIWNLLVAVMLAGKFPKQNIVEWSRQLLGKWIGWLFSVCVICIMYFWGIGMFWELWHLIVFTQLTNTPVFLPAILVVGGVFYLLYQGLESFARFAEVTVLLLFAGFIAINAALCTNAEFTRLLPVWDLPLDKLNHPHVIASLFIFRGIFIIYFVFKYLNRKKRLLPLSIISLTIAFVEILLALILPIAIFGAEAAGKSTFPYQESLSSVSFAWLPFQKPTFLTPMLWQIIFVYVSGISLFCTTEGISSLLNIRNKKRILLVLSIITLLLAMKQVTSVQLNRMIVIWSFTGLITFTIIPTLMWVILSIRRLAKT